MNILSLFDGMSCGQIALNRIGITPVKYYASEIDKYAIRVTQANYPKTIQVGDILNWRSWDIDWSGIDLIIGGSPCQGFSFAGKQLAFDDPRSKLFFTFLEILEHVRSLNPAVKFLLENVKMKKEYLAVITDKLGVGPVLINSALLSAQNRQRYYWCNWDVDQPENRGIVLADIIENGNVDRDKSHCLDANYFKGGNLKSYFEKHRRQLVFNITQAHPRCADVNILGSSFRPFKIDGRRGSLSEIGTVSFITGKSQCLTTSHSPKLATPENLFYRKLTPIECEALQTVPRNYTAHASNTQRYRMLGNGWTVDVIAHILKQGLKQ